MENKKIQIRAARVLQSDFGTGHHTNIVDVKISDKQMYFIQDVANKTYKPIAYMDHNRAKQKLDMHEARPISIENPSQIEIFGKAITDYDRNSSDKVISDLIDILKQEGKFVEG